MRTKSDLKALQALPLDIKVVAEGKLKELEGGKKCKKNNVLRIKK